MQTTLDPALQQYVVDALARQYPDHVDAHPAPMLVALPAGIHPYDRNPGYYDTSGNAIVAYQDWGRSIRRHGVDSPILKDFVQHELAHWFQHHILGESGGSTVNIHRRTSWSESCFVATSNLWPELGMTRIQFTPTMSIRTDAGVRKVPREGALTDVRLHHWPWSLFDGSR